MRLVDLEPRWINENVFTFLCPCCRKITLTCKNVPMSRDEQWALLEKALGEYFNTFTVLTIDSFAWSFSTTDFSLLTVSPSIDAGPSGHWHGHIELGEIKP